MLRPIKTASARLIIIVELLIAVFFVIAYNIFDILPFSETIFIFLLVLICFIVHRTGWSSLGFKREQVSTKAWIVDAGSIHKDCRTGISIFAKLQTLTLGFNTPNLLFL